jgi:hypothetical protein
MDKYLLSFENNELKKNNDKNNYKVIYNEEQLAFIENPLEDCKLLGIPGGGKTQSIIGKIIYHYSKGDINANNQFLILTFSRRACSDFIEKGRRQNKYFFNSKNIRTLHSVAGTIIYKILKKNSSSQDTVIISSIDLINQYKESVLELNEFKNLKVIFVDEAQDISNIQYDFILKIAELTKCKVILIGDPNQNIYQFQKGSDKYLINHSGKIFSLIKNYRSTPHLVNFINHFRPWDSLTPKMVSTKDDNDPFNKKPVIFIGTINEIIKDITDKILKSPFPKEEIAIIGPVKKSKPVQDSYTNIGLSLFTNLLNDYNIQYVKHYEDTNNDETMMNEYKKVPDHINLFTIHGSKGLEFHQVFLLNFHTSTYGIIPTEEKYKEFKYLWYVGLSRVSYDMNIYIDKNKMPWNELKGCPLELYVQENNIPKFNKELKFQEEIVPIYYSVTEILNSKKYLDDQLLFRLQNIFEYDVEEISIFEEEKDEQMNGHTNEKRIKNYKDFCALYGIFIENIFNYYYSKKYSKCADYIIKLKKIILNTIIIPKKYIYGYKVLKVRCPFISKNLVKLSDFISIKNQFQKCEEDIFSYLCEALDHNYTHEFFIDCENDVTNYSKKDLMKSILFLEKTEIELLQEQKIIIEDFAKMAKEQKKKDKIIKHILKITIFYYQRTNETAYLWKYNFEEELKDLDFYINQVIQFTNNVNEEFTFHPIIKHSKLPLIGELDLYNQRKIVDIKFSNHLNVKHILQIVLYHHMINLNYKEKFDLELWNFHLGKKFIIHLHIEKINVYELLKILSKSVKQKLNNMIFLYDLETTGLEYANNKIDIIDRHFEEYESSIVVSSGLLKPVNVPFIPFKVTSMTGITKDMVDESGQSIDLFRSELNEVLNVCNQPLFITYYGNNFDHKLLFNKNILQYNQCRILDARLIIRLFLNDMITNKGLSDIFKFLFHYSPVNNRAHLDVKMIISIFKKLGITEEKLLNM